MVTEQQIRAVFVRGMLFDMLDNFAIGEDFA